MDALAMCYHTIEKKTRCRWEYPKTTIVSTLIGDSDFVFLTLKWTRHRNGEKRDLFRYLLCYCTAVGMQQVASVVISAADTVRLEEIVVINECDKVSSGR
jgi:hypothetical protein